uniref:NADH-ubiquinone oxidoreductase chain 3 n=1 Tax=Alpheus hoplocheles TaxID=2201221 RepID=A0A343XYJ4_9EUCA|nr:NADH dehydrogenase subunit 3 [Alpheus hoplocheles]AWK60856.1 NADH dehydrogenase subunit 3 [Alpheus hoplocheles]
MLSLSLFVLTIFIISVALMTVSSILSKKTINDREKNSPFECGFDPKGSARMPFSLRFFLIAVIFLIFDVEITLLLPLVPTISLANIKSWIMTGIFFLIILLLGLYHEWAQGALDWAE